MTPDVPGQLQLFDPGPIVVGTVRCPRCSQLAVELHLVDGHHVLGQHDAIYGTQAMHCFAAGQRTCALKTTYPSTPACICRLERA